MSSKMINFAPVKMIINEMSKKDKIHSQIAARTESPRRRETFNKQKQAN
jgi:hypothetical protein